MTLKRAIVLAIVAAALVTAMHLLRPSVLIIESAAEEPKAPPSDEFPFSPRPNRAREIHWKKWSPAAFDESKAAKKLVAISLTATWCQKCHEMDEGAFSDERVIRLLNEKFVCLRVDTDRFPEVKDWYLSDRGWPTTAICTPSGDMIAKTWFATGDVFLEFAKKAADEWDRDPEAVLKRTSAFQPPKRLDPVKAESADVEAILKAIETTWAADGSGWAAGDYRFPMPQNIELCLAAGGSWTDRAGAGAEKTLKLEDPVEFGFYRVAMKPDWTDPHFEKLLETNAWMLSVLSRLWQARGDAALGKAASRTLEWMTTTLAQKDGGWSASQDADADYFGLDKAGREKRAKPHVDPSFYSGPNALAASAHFAYAAASGDAAARDAALRALERVFRECWTAEGLSHGSGGGSDLLRDLALTGDACLDAHQATGEWSWVKRASDVAARLAKLADDDGSLLDRPADPSAPGRLRFSLRRSPDNGRAAGFLARLHHVTGEESWQKVAELALKATGAEAVKYPAYGAEYALAVKKLRSYPLHLVLVGPRAELPKMVAAADRFWHPWKTVTVLESNGASVKHADLEYPPELAAYACVAEACGPPVTNPANFDAEVQAFVERNR